MFEFGEGGPHPTPKREQPARTPDLNSHPVMSSSMTMLLGMVSNIGKGGVDISLQAPGILLSLPESNMGVRHT